MRLAASLPLLIAFTLSARADDIAGVAFCAAETAATQACRVAWRWTGSPPQHHTVQRFEPAARSWVIVEESAGSQTGQSAEPVEAGHLYRVRACADVQLDQSCMESTAIWAPVQPRSAEDIPEVVVTQRGRTLSVARGAPFETQVIQYNVYQLEVEIEGVDAADLPPMTAPGRRWGAKGFRQNDNLTNNIYEVYSAARKGRSTSPTADASAAKEFITDVPAAEHERFRAKRVRDWPEQTMIVFGPAKAKYTVTVFADITCEHCAALLRDLDELNQLGVRIQFLAFPLTGPNSETGRKMADVWCAANPKDAFQRAVRKEPIPPARCDRPIVPYQYALARQLGISGSPSIITEDGRLVGYLPPKELVAFVQKRD